MYSAQLGAGMTTGLANDMVSESMNSEKTNHHARIGEAEADVVVPVVGGVVVAIGNTQVLRVVVPAPAADHAVRA